MSSGFLDGQHQGWKAPDEQVRRRYNLAPTHKAPILIDDSEAGLEGVMARWDFVPWFRKEPLEAKKWSIEPPDMVLTRSDAVDQRTLGSIQAIYSYII